MTIHHPCQVLLPLNLPMSPPPASLGPMPSSKPARRPNLLLVPKQGELTLVRLCLGVKLAAD
jgi:hypothetical protein